LIETTTAPVPKELQGAYRRYRELIVLEQKQLWSIFGRQALGVVLILLPGLLVLPRYVDLPHLLVFPIVISPFLMSLPIGLRRAEIIKERELIERRFKDAHLRICHDPGLHVDVVPASW